MAQSAEDVKRAYSVFLAKAWTDPTFDKLLSSDPAAALRQSGVDLPTGVTVEIIRPTGNPNLGEQLQQLEQAKEGDTLKVVVPASAPDSVQNPEKIGEGAADTSYCCCSCPSCSCT